MGPPNDVFSNAWCTLYLSILYAHIHGVHRVFQAKFMSLEKQAYVYKTAIVSLKFLYIKLSSFITGVFNISTFRSRNIGISKSNSLCSFQALY